MPKNFNICCPECPICGAETYLHHDYEHYSRFKCSYKKCNHIHVILKKSIFYEPLAQEINSKFNFKRLRTNLNIVIDALYMYQWFFFYKSYITIPVTQKEL